MKKGHSIVIILFYNIAFNVKFEPLVRVLMHSTVESITTSIASLTYRLT
jgi:hypothetical protein